MVDVVVKCVVSALRCTSIALAVVKIMLCLAMAGGDKVGAEDGAVVRCRWRGSSRTVRHAACVAAYPIAAVIITSIVVFVLQSRFGCLSSHVARLVTLTVETPTSNSVAADGLVYGALRTRAVTVASVLWSFSPVVLVVLRWSFGQFGRGAQVALRHTDLTGIRSGSPLPVVAALPWGVLSAATSVVSLVVVANLDSFSCFRVAIAAYGVLQSLGIARSRSP